MARAAAIWCFLFVIACCTLAVALAVGSSNYSPVEVVRALFTSGDSMAADIVRHLRLPRALAAFSTGGLLALSGALMQVLLRNPLADPYILGLSGGAAVAALGAMLLGLGAAAVNVSAGIGAFAAIVLVVGVARRDFAGQQVSGTVDASPRLLLTGVVLAAGWGALVAVILTLAPDAQLRGMLFWLAGDLNGVQSWLPPSAVLICSVVVIYPAARDLNVLLRGEALAHALGVRVLRLRWTIYLVAATATAVAVTTAGTIGFVGLVVPHALRLVIGNDQRVLLPACALAGGVLLLLADTAARTAVAPMQLPVGMIMALIGVPAFMFLLTRKPGRV